MPINELLRLLLTFAVMFLGVRTEAGAPPPPVVAITPAVPAVAPATALAEALNYAPADMRLLQFGDWTLLREYAGIDGEANPASAAETTRRLLPRAEMANFSSRAVMPAPPPPSIAPSGAGTSATWSGRARCNWTMAAPPT